MNRIDRLLKGNASLRDTRGYEIFANAFAYLNSLAWPAEAVFDDVLKVVFNAPATAALHVENLKG
ncbi:MAG: hypothetical protein ACRDIY_04535, partial [Chloroflexota bacterium]